MSASAWLARFALPRTLHPGAWWLWALCLAVAASRTTNPVLLMLIIAVTCYVVVSRRPDSPWGLAFRLYLYLGLLIVIVRVVFRVIFNGNGPTVLFTLPQIQLPDVMAGVQLLGPVSAESLLSGFYDGLRLATMIICIGAANALANPKRLLAAVPSALYEIGTVLVVSLSVFPQLAESVGRVRRARSLRRGPGKGRKAVRGIIVPVLADALDRSLKLAAAMDSRGYGRMAQVSIGKRRVTSLLLILGLLGLGIGAYGVLDSTMPRYLGGPMLLGGGLIAAIGLRMSGKRVQRSRYRPDRWAAPEIVVLSCGVITATVYYLISTYDPAMAYPSVWPMIWPHVGIGVLVATVIAGLPAWLSPLPEVPGDSVLMPLKIGVGA